MFKSKTFLIIMILLYNNHKTTAVEVSTAVLFLTFDVFFWHRKIPTFFNDLHIGDDVDAEGHLLLWRLMSFCCGKNAV